MIISLDSQTPDVDSSCFVADGARIVADVKVGKDSNVWYGAVIRGDEAGIVIGERTNVQDLSILHVDRGYGLSIGDDVTIGHKAIVHGCTVHNRVLIGMGAIIMNGAEIGEGSIIGAGALITEGTIVPPRSLVIGMPGRVKREVTEEEMTRISESAEHYVETARSYIRSKLSFNG